MGNAASGESASQIANMSAAEVANAMERVLEEGKSIEMWEALWTGIAKKRDESFDSQLIQEGVIKHLKSAFHSDQDLDWKLSGISKAMTFFPYSKARKRLVVMDFVGAVMLLTMAKGPLETTEDANQLKQLQVLAANTFCKMADYKDFEAYLCSASVLNFLCIVLNQIEEAEELVTLTFKKLARTPDNLVVLIEGSVGDILESYFKLSFDQLEKETDEATASAQVSSYRQISFFFGGLYFQQAEEQFRLVQTGIQILSIVQIKCP